MNKFIDHTLLKATATAEDVIKLCKEAIQYEFMSVCVNPAFIATAKQALIHSDVLVCSVIGFPLGANTMESKWNEAIDAIQNGADELDMVLNIGKLKEHDYNYLTEEIKGVVAIARGRTVKVILETCYLSDEEKIEACHCAAIAGAHFVKTSTGFGTGGATLEDVRLMRANVPSEMGVKASGGVRSLEDAEKFIAAGANRIGTSGGVAIMSNLTNKEGY